MSETYCPMPWVGLNILPGQVRPCCYWEGAVQPVEQIREDMLAGKKLAGCNQCYFAEQVGAPSKRLESIEKYGFVTDVNLQVLEVTFDNLCNLKCRGCCGYTSHKWHNDEIEIYGEPFVADKYVESVVDVDCTNLKQVDISGGEPFLSKNVNKFVKDLANIGDIELGIVTSGYHLPSDALREAMTRAKKLYLTISIDAIGELNDYFRSGSKFEVILKNIEQLNNLCDDDHKIIIHSTVSIYNVTYIKEVETYFAKHYPHFKIQHRLLQWPEQLAIQHMPDGLKKVVRPIVESFGPDFNDVLEAIDLPGKDLYGHFLNYHKTLDALRNETLPNTLLDNYIKNNNTQVESKIFFNLQKQILSS